MFGNFEFIQDEIENWGEIGFDVGGENLGAHAEDSGQVLFENAVGEKEGDDGLDGFHGGCAEIRVLGEGFACIDTHYLKT